MKVAKQIVMIMGVCVVAMGFAAMSANAEELFRGKFELPAAVYCGNTLLQPGQYTIRMSAVSEAVSDIRVEGEGAHANVLIATELPRDKSNHASLTIANANGTFYISAFNDGLGKSFQFGTSKRVGEHAFDALNSMTVPVSAAGF